MSLQELFDEYEQKSKEPDLRHDIVNFDPKCLMSKPVAITLPFENKSKRLKFDDNETVMTFLNYYPSPSADDID